MESDEKINEKIKYLNTIKNANVRAHNHKASIIEAFIAKGDRRVGQAIFKAWKKGAKFDEWADKFNFQIWQEAIKESGLDINFYVYRQRQKDEIFSWDHLNFGLSKDELWNDYQKGINESSAPVSQNIFGNYKTDFPNTFTKPKDPIPPQRRFRIRLSKTGQIKFISHLEQTEVLRRAIRRSKLPTAFTGGFSPQIKASFGPPLPVGYESFCEYIDLSLVEKLDKNLVSEALSKTLPQGLKILDIKTIPINFDSIEALVNLVEYKLENFGITQKQIDDFLALKNIIVSKSKKGKVIETDIRSVISDIKISDNFLVFLFNCEHSRALKPDIVLQKLTGNENLRIFNCTRTNLYVKTSLGKCFIL
jgi:radical SAM-linked protein